MSVELTKKQENHIRRLMDKKSVYQLASETGLSVYRVKKAVKEFRADAARKTEPPAPAPQPAAKPIGKFAVQGDSVMMTEAQATSGDEAMGTSPFSTTTPVIKENQEFFGRHKNNIHRIRPE